MDFCSCTCVFPYFILLGNQKAFRPEAEVEGGFQGRSGVGFIPVDCYSGARSMTPCGVLAITTIEEADCAR